MVLLKFRSLEKGPEELGLSPLGRRCRSNGTHAQSLKGPGEEASGSWDSELWGESARSWCCVSGGLSEAGSKSVEGRQTRTTFTVGTGSCCQGEECCWGNADRNRKQTKEKVSLPSSNLQVPRDIPDRQSLTRSQLAKEKCHLQRFSPSLRKENGEEETIGAMKQWLNDQQPTMYQALHKSFQIGDLF